VGLRSWIRKLGGRPEPATATMAAPAAAPKFTAYWVSAAESPFGVEVLDCRESARVSTALTNDRNFGPRWARLLQSDGEEYRGTSPEDPMTFECDLLYPAQEPPPDGALFKGMEMEDKWHIYHLGGDLYFTRSWSGELIYRAAIAFVADGTRLTSVTAASGYKEDGARYCIDSVHYLLASHLYGLVCAHPLPARLGRDPATLETFSWVEHGRRGLFGTFANVWEMPCLQRRAPSEAAGA